MEHMRVKTTEDIYVIRHILSALIGSYVVGWLILVVNLGRVPLLNPILWQLGSLSAMMTTIWLALTLSKTSLIWWASVTLSVVTIRSFAYAQTGIFNPLGVWLLVLSGVLVTCLSVIAVNAITGRLGKLAK